MLTKNYPLRSLDPNVYFREHENTNRLVHAQEVYRVRLKGRIVTEEAISRKRPLVAGPYGYALLRN